MVKLFFCEECNRHYLTARQVIRYTTEMDSVVDSQKRTVRYGDSREVEGSKVITFECERCGYAVFPNFYIQVWPNDVKLIQKEALDAEFRRQDREAQKKIWAEDKAKKERWAKEDKARREIEAIHSRKGS